MTAILRLFFARCPAAIFRRVGAVVVNALDSQAGWGLTHIGNKICDIEPAFADSNSAPTVVFPLRIVRICTAADNLSVNIIGFCARQAVRAPWAGHGARAGTLSLITSAALDLTRTQFVTPSIELISAVALATPKGCMIALAYIFNDLRFIKPLAAKVQNRSAHWSCYA